MQHFNKSILAVAAMLAATQTNAQEDSAKTKQALQPVEVRSLRAGSNAPFVTTEVTSKDIEKANLGQDLPYLLQYTPSRALPTITRITGPGSLPLSFI